MPPIRFDTLLRPAFLICLGLLLVNDFYFKQAYSNFWTGKLSDFAGLFIFPYFIASFRIKSANKIYYITALLFVFWKSEFSQFIIDFVRSAGITIDRVMDYTDLAALLILPISYKELQKQAEKYSKTQIAMGMMISTICLFAILATSVRKDEIALNSPVGKIYKLQMSKTQFFKSLQPGSRYSDTLSKNLTDSIFYLYFDIPGYHTDIKVLSTITAVGTEATYVRLDTVVSASINGGISTGANADRVENIREITPKEFEQYFEEHFIEKLKNKESQRLYYDNKEIYELYP